MHCDRKSDSAALRNLMIHIGASPNKAVFPLYREIGISVCRYLLLDLLPTPPLRNYPFPKSIFGSSFPKRSSLEVYFEFPAMSAWLPYRRKSILTSSPLISSHLDNLSFRPLKLHQQQFRSARPPQRVRLRIQHKLI